MIILKKKENGQTQSVVYIRKDAISWVEVTERFIDFLQSCGYVVDGYDVGLYLTQEYAFQNEDRDDEGGNKG